MTPEEVVDLLSLIAARDRRTVGDVDLIVWVEDIGDLDYTEAAQAAAEHFREQPDTWLMAGHIRQRVKAARAKRIAAAGVIAEHKAMHGRDVGNERAHRDALRRIHHELGSGDQPPPFRALEAGLAEAVKPDDTSKYRRLRETWDAEQKAKAAAAKAEREARIAEQEAEHAATRKVTRAYGLLMVLTPEAQEAAVRQAREELGDTATKDDVVVRAANVADHSEVADIQSAETIRQNLARQPCRYGCEIGTHEKPCPYAGDDAR